MISSYVWFHWALLSAAFASLTAIFAKITDWAEIFLVAADVVKLGLKR